MRGSIVVLALALTPLVAPIAQGQHQHFMRSHVSRHDMPLGWRHDDRNNRRDDNRRDKHRSDNKCSDSKGHDNWFSDWWSWWFGDKKKGNDKCGSPPPSDPPPQDPPPQDPPPPDTTPAHGFTIIQGLVFTDADQNGAQSADEAGLSGWTVQLTGPMNLTAVTGPDGRYEFDGLVSGLYLVCVSPPAGWTQTAISGAPSCGSNLTGYNLQGLELSSDVAYMGVDFGFRQN
jgi:hypothetical protein